MGYLYKSSLAVLVLAALWIVQFGLDPALVTDIMGFIKTSLVVLVLAVVLSKLPGWFQSPSKAPPVTGTVEPGWEHVRDVYR